MPRGGGSGGDVSGGAGEHEGNGRGGGNGGSKKGNDGQGGWGRRVYLFYPVQFFFSGLQKTLAS